MNNRTVPILIIAVLAVLAAGYLLVRQQAKPNQVDEQAAVRAVVTDFGQKLKNVSLLQPKNDVAQSIKSNYGSDLSPDLLAQWENDQTKALGRQNSSPWPDRIEITAVNKIGNGQYSVSGDIVEVTSAEQSQGGAAAKRSVQIVVSDISGSWLITSVVPGPYETVTFRDQNQHISFEYPEKLPTQFIDAQQWPPKITVSSGAYSCAQTPPTSSLPARTAEKVVGDNTYCVSATSEGAAGSTYTTYKYTTKQNGKLIKAEFVLRFPQCLNYDNPQRQACTTERETFDLDSLINQIVSSVKST